MRLCMKGTSLRVLLGAWLMATSLPLSASSLIAATLTVTPDGVLLKQDAPFCAMGVNYVDVFWRHLANANDRSYERGFAELAAHGIPFVRFAASAYWPNELRLYETDRQTYLSRLDDVVRAAEANGIGLIPSLFWTHFSAPDLVNEPVGQWGNPASATIAFMVEYTRDIVSRYRASPAIWAWEFGNEFTLQVDLPNAAAFRPPVNPELGTPPFRTAADDLRTSAILNAFQLFGATVRELDDRLVTTGNAMPRSQAERIRHTGRWSLSPDTRADFINNLQLVNPPTYFQLSSVHLHYPDDVTSVRFSRDYQPSLDELASLATLSASEIGQAVFVGEFGASDAVRGGNAAAVAANRAIVDALVRQHVPLSAVWVYDFPQQDPDGWNITYTNARRSILQSIEDANRAFQEGECVTRR